MTSLDAKAEAVLALFRAGSDTMEIAIAMGLLEPTVSRLLWVARSREKRLPATFMNRDGKLKQIAA